MSELTSRIWQWVGELISLMLDNLILASGGDLPLSGNFMRSRQISRLSHILRLFSNASDLTTPTLTPTLQQPASPCCSVNQSRAAARPHTRCGSIFSDF